VQDRQFEIGGELFEWAYPHWEVGAQLWDGDDREEEEGETNGKTAFTFRGDTEWAIERIPLFLDPKNDSKKRWKTLVARKTNPVPRYQIIALYKWLFQVTSNLPTNPPSDLEPGGGDSAESSEEESS
jgi:hypothetical protein